MEAGVLQIVALAGGGDGAHVADVLHHGGQRQRHDGHGGGHQHAGVQVGAGEQAEQGVLKLEGQAQPRGLDYLGEVHIAADGTHHIGGDDAQQDGDDLDHALAPDVAGHHDQNGHQSDGPVGAAGIDGGLGQGQADADDDGAGDDGGEVAHDRLSAEHLEQGGQDHIHQAGAGHAEAGVGQHLGIGDGGVAGGVGQHGGDGRVAADKGEGGAQESGDLHLGQEVEQQGAQACEQQGGGDGQAGQRGDQHCGAEHGEHVLDAQDQHLGGAKDAGVINGVILIHLSFLPSSFQIYTTQKKTTTAR